MIISFGIFKYLTIAFPVCNQPFGIFNIWLLCFLSFDIRHILTLLVTSSCACILFSSTLIYIHPPFREDMYLVPEKPGQIYILIYNLRQMFIYWIFILSIIEIQNVVYLFFPLNISNGSNRTNERNCHFIRFKFA